MSKYPWIQIFPIKSRSLSNIPSHNRTNNWFLIASQMSSHNKIWTFIIKIINISISNNRDKFHKNIAHQHKIVSKPNHFLSHTSQLLNILLFLIRITTPNNFHSFFLRDSTIFKSLRDNNRLWDYLITLLKQKLHSMSLNWWNHGMTKSRGIQSPWTLSSGSKTSWMHIRILFQKRRKSNIFRVWFPFNYNYFPNTR